MKVTAIKKKSESESFSEETEEHWDDFCDWLEASDKPPIVQWFSRAFLHKLTIEAPVVILFCLLCAIVFGLQKVFPGLTRFLAVDDRFRWMQMKQLSSLFTHVLAHSNVNHIKGNMMHILLVGPSAEHVYGSNVLLLVILLVAVSSAVTHILIGSSYTQQLGASGVVFAFILLNSLVAAVAGKIPLSFVLTAGFWGFDELYKLFFANDGVSHHAHLTGAVVGAAVAIGLRRQKLKTVLRRKSHWSSVLLSKVKAKPF